MKINQVIEAFLNTADRAEEVARMWLDADIGSLKRELCDRARTAENAPRNCKDITFREWRDAIRGVESACYELLTLEARRRREPQRGDGMINPVYLDAHHPYWEISNRFTIARGDVCDFGRRILGLAMTPEADDAQTSPSTKARRIDAAYHLLEKQEKGKRLSAQAIVNALKRTGFRVKLVTWRRADRAELKHRGIQSDRNDGYYHPKNL